MKTALKISFLVNLVLLAGLVSMRTGREVSPAPMVAGGNPDREQPIRIAALVAPPAKQLAQPEPFHWSQLESSDYNTYVKNLRRIGCPEATLQAIVAADVDSVYRERNDDLRQKLAGYEQLSWEDKLKAYNAKQAWLAELQTLPAAKKSQMDNLLATPAGSAPASVQATVAAASSGTPTVFPGTAPLATSTLVQHHDTQPIPELPLVYHDVDLSTLNFNEQQIQTVHELRQTFVEEIGGPNQDPADPDYLQRWLKAQSDVDNLAKGMLGVMPWQTYQIAVMNQSR